MEIECLLDVNMALDLDSGCAHTADKTDNCDRSGANDNDFALNGFAIVNDVDCGADATAAASGQPSPVDNRLSGFYNLGNTCYQNSIIQCLINNKTLLERIADHVTGDDAANDSDESVAKVFLELRDEYQKSSDAIRTEKLRQLVSRDYQWTLDGAQHDSQEFLMILLDLMHEKTRKLAKKIKTCDQTVDQSEREWQRVQSTEGVSPISETFRGQMRSKVTCQQCLGESATFEPFMYLCLPLPVSIEAEVRLRVHRPEGDVVEDVLRTENKFQTVFSLKSQIKEKYFPNIDESDLLLAEGTRALDQSEDISAFLNKTIDCYELNRLQSDDSSAADNACDESGLTVGTAIPLSHPSTLVQCPICLDELDVSVVLAHDLCGGAICRNCLPQLAAHSSDSTSNRFHCCTCSIEVTEHDFRPLDNPNSTVYVIPVLINDWLMIRVRSRMRANELYSLIDTKIPLNCVQNEWKLIFREKESNQCSKCIINCSGCEVARNGIVQLMPSDALKVVFTDETKDLTSDETPMPSLMTTSASCDSVEPTETANTITSNGARTLTLNDCFTSFIQNESLETEIYCDNCKRMSKSNRRLSIERPPSTLIVHLKRFLFFDNKCHKITDRIEFAEELDLKPIMSDNSRPVKYRLLALVLHNGNSNNGHYLAQIRVKDQWYLCDDHRVSRQSPQWDDSRAYILFYSRRDPTLDSDTNDSKSSPSMTSDDTNAINI